MNLLAPTPCLTLQSLIGTRHDPVVGLVVGVIALVVIAVSVAVIRFGFRTGEHTTRVGDPP